MSASMAVRGGLGEAVIVGTQRELAFRLYVTERTVCRWVRIPGFPTRDDELFDTVAVAAWRDLRRFDRMWRTPDSCDEGTVKFSTDAELAELLGSLPTLEESMGEFDRVFGNDDDAKLARTGGDAK